MNITALARERARRQWGAWRCLHCEMSWTGPRECWCGRDGEHHDVITPWPGMKAGHELYDGPYKRTYAVPQEAL